MDEALGEKAKAAADALTKTGFKVALFNYVNVIRVEIDGIYWYVDNLPELDNYGVLINGRLKTCCKECCGIVIEFDNKTHWEFNLFVDSVGINGYYYTLISKCKYEGHLRGNVFTKYSNVWIRNDLSNYLDDLLTDGKLPDDIDNKILNADFTPVESQVVNIKNEGLKFVARLQIGESKIQTFTLFITEFGETKYITKGKYTYNFSCDIFKYKNGDSDDDVVTELFAALINPHNKRVSLASSDKVIALIDVGECIVERDNGQYVGYEVGGKYITKYFKYNKVYPTVYKFKDTFFSFKLSKPVELDARMPGSGMRTKPAAMDSII
jgi:hypothetical protein